MSKPPTGSAATPRASARAAEPRARSDDHRQTADDRGRKADGGQQTADDGARKTDGRARKTDDGAELPDVRDSGPQSPTTSGLVRTGGRAADVVAFEEALVGFFIGAADLLGVPKSVGAIYGICFASPEPLSFSEINERLEISSGSISQGLKVLREVGALKIATGGPEGQKAGGPEDGRRRTDGGGRTADGGRQTTDDGERTADGGQQTTDDGRKPAERAIDRASARLALARTRERFEPDLELRKIVIHYIEQRLQKQLDSGHARLKAVAKMIPEINPADAERLRDRFGSLQTWHAKTRALLPIAKTFLKLT